MTTIAKDYRTTEFRSFPPERLSLLLISHPYKNINDFKHCLKLKTPSQEDLFLISILTPAPQMFSKTRNAVDVKMAFGL